MTKRLLAFVLIGVCFGPISGAYAFLCEQAQEDFEAALDEYTDFDVVSNLLRLKLADLGIEYILGESRSREIEIIAGESIAHLVTSYRGACQLAAHSFGIQMLEDHFSGMMSEISKDYASLVTILLAGGTKTMSELIEEKGKEWVKSELNRRARAASWLPEVYRLPNVPGDCPRTGRIIWDKSAGEYAVLLAGTCNFQRKNRSIPVHGRFVERTVDMGPFTICREGIIEVRNLSDDGKLLFVAEDSNDGWTNAQCGAPNSEEPEEPAADERKKSTQKDKAITQDPKRESAKAEHGGRGDKMKDLATAKPVPTSVKLDKDIVVQGEEPFGTLPVPGNWIITWSDYPEKGQSTQVKAIVRKDWRLSRIPASNGGTFYRWEVKPSSELAFHTRYGRYQDGMIKRQNGSYLIDWPYYTLGYWGGKSTLNNISGSQVSGRWFYSDNEGKEQWQRVEPTIERVVYRFGQSSFETTPGGTVGQVVMTWTDWWEEWNDMRGNRPGFRIEVYGQNLWGHHLVDIPDGIDMEPDDINPIRSESGDVIGIALRVNLWPHVTSGRKTLRVDNISMTFDFVVREHPTLPVPSGDGTSGGITHENTDEHVSSLKQP